mgnify:CR=1 FL=1
MADEEQEETKKSKLPLILGATLLFLGLAGGGAYFFLFSSGEDGSSDGHGGASKDAHGETSGDTHSEASGDAHSKASGDAHNAGSGDAHGEGAGDAHSEGSGDAHSEASGGDKTSHDSDSSEDYVNFGRIYEFRPFHLNLGNPMENRYIRLGIAIEYKSGNEQLREIEARKVQLRDAIVSIVGEKTREFILAPDGKDQLRLEIFNQINQYMDRKIEAVYISDLIVE